jgi:hypothetical protein
MLQSAKTCATTLKHIPDKWIARDGCEVVLSATPRELLLLRYEEPDWRITRHDPVAPDATERILGESVNVHGSRYASHGTTLHVLLESDSDDVWRAVYRTLLRV